MLATSHGSTAPSSSMNLSTNRSAMGPTSREVAANCARSAASAQNAVPASCIPMRGAVRTSRSASDGSTVWSTGASSLRTAAAHSERATPRPSRSDARPMRRSASRGRARSAGSRASAAAIAERPALRSRALRAPRSASRTRPSARSAGDSAESGASRRTRPSARDASGPSVGRALGLEAASGSIGGPSGTTSSTAAGSDILW
mmetsp:Transcript_72440/g.212280  ORF Transcript_72440/g.212280 Transcript_72440/m.212280 type:complete len:203 (-) Transcript_72440:325-933(-)